MNLDAMRSALAYVASEWGGSDDGYRVEAVRPIGSGIVAVDIVHSDGSRFTVAADRWGVPRDPESGAAYRWVEGAWVTPEQYARWENIGSGR